MTWKGVDCIYSESFKMQLQNRIENMVLILYLKEGLKRTYECKEKRPKE